MVVGTDTYVTVDEADAYAITHYRSTRPERLRWTALSEDDKTILLRDACSSMEQLPFQGRKAEIGQLLSFPRYGQDTVPDNVKAAQIELALWLSDDAKQTELEQRKALQDQGVTAFSVGDLSETYGGAADRSPVLACPKAKTLLWCYLTGAYATV